MTYVYAKGALVAQCKKLGADKIWDATLHRLHKDSGMMTQNKELFQQGEKGDRKIVFASKDIPKGTLLPWSISPIDIAKVKIPPIENKAIDLKLLEREVRSYLETESQCNVEYYYDASQKEREWGCRVSRDVKKGEQLWNHFTPAQWIVQQVLCSNSLPNMLLSNESLTDIEGLCIKLIGEDLKGALTVFIYALE